MGGITSDHVSIESGLTVLGGITSDHVSIESGLTVLGGITADHVSIEAGLTVLGGLSVSNGITCDNLTFNSNNLAKLSLNSIVASRDLVIEKLGDPGYAVNSKLRIESETKNDKAITITAEQGGFELRAGDATFSDAFTSTTYGNVAIQGTEGLVFGDESHDTLLELLNDKSSATAKNNSGIVIRCKKGKAELD